MSIATALPETLGSMSSIFPPAAANASANSGLIEDRAFENTASIPKEAFVLKANLIVALGSLEAINGFKLIIAS